MAPLVVGLAVTTALGGGLQRRIEELVRSADLRDTQASITVVDLTDGEELVAINPTRPMMPASNMKIIITAAALRLLGPDFVFRTELSLIQPEERKSVEGMVMTDTGFTPHEGPVLVIKGDGDPAFGDSTLLKRVNMDVERLLQTWVESVRGTGVTRVERLIVDDRAFDRQFVHHRWPADQLNLWYCAEVAGINFNDNCLDVYVDPTELNQTPRVALVPHLPSLNFTNRAVTGKNNTFWISRRPHSNELTFWGQVMHKRSDPFYVTIHDPPMFLAQVMAHRLGQSGVRVESVGRAGWDDILPPGRKLHVVQTTLPLVLERCNKDSQNLFAEALLKRIGRRFTGAPGSWENGAAAIRVFLNQMIGPRSAAVMVVDGSGLSRDNRVTTRVLVDVLQDMYRDPTLGPLYRKTLAVGGVDGTLDKRFKGKLSGRVYGKSGYIDGVSSLSGYLVRDEGPGEHVIAFSFIFNNFKPPVYAHQIKRLQDDLVGLIDQELEAHEPVTPRLGG